jgi:DNA-binding NtrC family response regulator
MVDQTTENLSFGSLATLQQDAPFSLIVLRDGDASVYPLAKQGRLVIGRAQHADIRIDHPSVSREHAALHCGESISLEDLGSANGTRLQSRRLTQGVPAEVAPDTVIDLGEVLLVVQHRRLEQNRWRSSSPAFFELRLEEECLRALDTQASFAVARLEIAGELGARAAELLLVSALGPRDLVTSSRPGCYELLLLDVDSDEARKRVERASDVLSARNLKVQSNLACAPRDGSTPGALLGRKLALPLASAKPPDRADFVVLDDVMRRTCRLLERVADSELSVILLGETGVGKEMCAELVHGYSPRATRRLVRFNCAALSETLLEAELFGHERGAFTGASAERVGLLESANGGSVFLDEVGDMPLSTQVKLLRVLEAKEVLRLGSRTPRAIDVRVIAATNRNLRELITAGLFREDLFYRLNGISVLIPPLRERARDIEPLARHFVARYAKAGRPLPALSSESVAWLESQPWPGNVRELRNLVERALILCDGPVLLPSQLALDPGQRSSAYDSGPLTPPAESGTHLRDEVKALERERIERALHDTEGNQRLAAEVLGLSRGALLRRLEQLGITRPRKGRSAP